MAVEVSDDNVANFLRLLTGEDFRGTNDDKPRALAPACPSAVDGREYVEELAYFGVAREYPRPLDLNLEYTAIWVEYLKPTIVGDRRAAIESALADDIASVLPRMLKALMTRLPLNKLTIAACSVWPTSTAVRSATVPARHCSLLALSKTAPGRYQGTAFARDSATVSCAGCWWATSSSFPDQAERGCWCRGA